MYKLSLCGIDLGGLLAINWRTKCVQTSVKTRARVGNTTSNSSLAERFGTIKSVAGLLHWLKPFRSRNVCDRQASEAVAWRTLPASVHWTRMRLPSSGIHRGLLFARNLHMRPLLTHRLLLSSCYSFQNQFRTPRCC